MAVGEISWPVMHSVKGVRLGTANARIKDTDSHDVTVIEVCEDAKVAGVFTQNAFCAEPVKIAKYHLASQSIRYLLINSGNANACTGEPGFDAAMQTCQSLAQHCNVNANQVLPFSTGVIGELLPAQKIIGVIPDALNSLKVAGWSDAAHAIMTTDTLPKGASTKFTSNECDISISGMAKGAGMINPNMATMLAFIATDADIAQPLLEQIAKEAADHSFNRITIDGDTSTNDACMIIATAKSRHPKISSASDPAYAKLLLEIKSVYIKLAQAIVRDGEGATKFITVDVLGGESEEECNDVAYAIAHSPLVKTAMFACDPNWGRIVCAIGYAGIENCDTAKIDVFLDDVKIVENGGRAASYTEEQGQEIVDKPEFAIRVNLNRGDVSRSIWTSDLSHEYVRINAEYRS